MPDDSQLALAEALAAEYGMLRPDSDYSGGDLADQYRRAHAETRPFAALCISGGGIRSATFALGVLQGLARHGILARFDYLSTVSGGGYIGSWLSAWMTRVHGLHDVVPRLRPDAPAPPAGEPDPVAHLREYNNYLTPKLGLLSADTWTVAGAVIRNISLNWLVLVPLLMFALMMPRVVLSVLAADDYWEIVRGTQATLDAIARAEWVLVGVALLAALAFAYTIFNVARLLPGIGGRPHSQREFLAYCLAPLIGAVLLFLAFDSLRFWGPFDQSKQPTAWWEVTSWTLVPCVVGWLAFLLFCGKPWRIRLRLLLGRLSAAVVLVGVSTGSAVWLFTNDLFPRTSWTEYTTLAPPVLLLSFDFAIGLFVGFTSAVLEDDDREWFARSLAWDLLASAIWIVACGLVLLAPRWAFEWPLWGNSAIGVAGAASGWATTLPGLAARARPGAGEGVVTRLLARVALALAPALFVVCLSIGLAALTNWALAETGALATHDAGVAGSAAPVLWTDHEELLVRTPLWLALAAALALLAFGAVMARYINVNLFSLHAMYRNRLIRAYPGASNPERRAGRAASFTGFLQSDDLCMHELRDAGAPLHVVNVALNLVSGERLAWQQRKAQSFTITPLHCGNHELGYRPADRYGGPNGLSLGTALAISGAAASPNMGYHSSPVIGFIMTLFNARLGSWLGNPGSAGARTWRHSGPRSAVASLVKEAFGLTTNRSAYVYLSDGGHFENLALYEMVLRRCRFIVVLDGGCDPEFTYEDLGNALRKIRIDLRVPISFKESDVAPLRAGRKRCAIGRIHYSSVDGPCEDGWLLYVKPMRLGNEPPDVGAYWRANATFPHQSTNDQWFDEAQTESYRMLGLHTVEEICERWSDGPLEALCEHVRNTYLSEPTSAPTATSPADAPG